jgi:hypothetical protein
MQVDFLWAKVKGAGGWHTDRPADDKQLTLFEGRQWKSIWTSISLPTS